MREFASKMDFNYALLKKDKAIKDGEVVLVKTYSNLSGEHELKYLLKKCSKCGELFFQSEKCRMVYTCCENCCKTARQREFINGKNKV